MVEEFYRNHGHVLDLTKRYEKLRKSLMERLTVSSRLNNRGANLLEEEKARDQVIATRKAIVQYLNKVDSGKESQLYQKWESITRIRVETQEELKGDPQKSKEMRKSSQRLSAAQPATSTDATAWRSHGRRDTKAHSMGAQGQEEEGEPSCRALGRVS
ncbi:uncharacterized protein LOC125943674 [Dermacentor silvarum]|uniref:uncharacterized protein LOC125943674 n=1 Tax=Dermacentor silvarum TaxID=543639 RepID=UPI002101B268|nr:uncharacterized protein LOC125943674 [Dermacentor silvarum]